MPAVTGVRPVLLSAPYAGPDNVEVQRHLPTGWRTTGLVEITLEDGSVGLGEAYLAVFAPGVFVETVKLLAPYLVGTESLDVAARYRDACEATGYWSLSGAARHVVGAIETALWDANGHHLGMPVHELLGGCRVPSIPLYGSGGDSATPDGMADELATAAAAGLATVKIRARHGEVDKAVWTVDRARELGIAVAVDMCQNLTVPGGTADDALSFLSRLNRPLAFLEEPLGLGRTEEYPLLRASSEVPIAGGEIVTTPEELAGRVRDGYYDIVQPDATVIGGLGPVLDVFRAGAGAGIRTVVHCWGSAVGMAANYHAAFAGGGRLAEWPLPRYPLRTEPLVEPFRITDGTLAAPTAPGLGVRLTPEIEQRYPFRPDAVYKCLVSTPKGDRWCPTQRPTGSTAPAPPSAGRPSTS
ncbi:mandelate racemase/muconate lactonizing enzyme family protein [Pseudonocardia acaciae]|uniref:mandelate racemase/muconate lactonizing enzyme family protein n=1 Tax=Pseudonocardia acaciae TaxID=551276 RepID=UPI00048BEA51|nr:mandelate racemase/muconate lactonizing enzyme family protein [Pseudonocardia acaciae]